MTTASNFAAQPIRYRDARRDHRLLLPRFRVVVDGYVLPTINWSLGGLLLQGPGPSSLAPDMPVSGLIGGNTRRGHLCMSFSARVARLVPAPLGVALSFVAADGALVDFLEGCLLDQLSRRGAR
jgi:hypothetical protein